MPFLLLPLFWPRERPRALGQGVRDTPPTHPALGPKGPKAGFGTAPLLSPLTSEELKAHEILVVQRLPARLLSSGGAEKFGNKVLLAHRESFHCTTKTQHRRGPRRFSKKLPALPICKGVSNCPPPARGSLRPAAHASAQGALCAQWHLSPSPRIPITLGSLSLLPPARGFGSS